MQLSICLYHLYMDVIRKGGMNLPDVIVFETFIALQQWGVIQSWCIIGQLLLNSDVMGLIQSVVYCLVVPVVRNGGPVAVVDTIRLIQDGTHTTKFLYYNTIFHHSIWQSLYCTIINQQQSIKGQQAIRIF